MAHPVPRWRPNMTGWPLMNNDRCVSNMNEGRTCLSDIDSATDASKIGQECPTHTLPWNPNTNQGINSDKLVLEEFSAMPRNARNWIRRRPRQQRLREPRRWLVRLASAEFRYEPRDGSGNTAPTPGGRRRRACHKLYAGNSSRPVPSFLRAGQFLCSSFPA